ncbi:MAG: hypothetical protein QXX41_13455 [Nitrososphaerota archaeon]
MRISLYPIRSPWPHTPLVVFSLPLLIPFMIITFGSIPFLGNRSKSDIKKGLLTISLSTPFLFYLSPKLGVIAIPLGLLLAFSMDLKGLMTVHMLQEKDIDKRIKKVKCFLKRLIKLISIFVILCSGKLVVTAIIS